MHYKCENCGAEVTMNMRNGDEPPRHIDCPSCKTVDGCKPHTPAPNALQSPA